MAQADVAMPEVCTFSWKQIFPLELPAGAVRHLQAKLPSAASEFGIPLTNKLARFLNTEQMQAERHKLHEGNEIMEVAGISGSGEDLRTELLNADPELLRVARGKDRIRSLRQFRPVYQELPPPSKTSTRFFLIRSSCDWSIIKSIRGYTVATKCGPPTRTSTRLCKMPPILVTM